MSEHLNAMPVAGDAINPHSSLVLSRGVEQAICLDAIAADGSTQRVTVRVVRIKGKHAQLRVTGPREIPIYREELGGPIRRRPRPIRQSPEAA